jgi:hypothetical protein
MNTEKPLIGITRVVSLSPRPFQYQLLTGTLRIGVSLEQGELEKLIH